MPTTLSIDLLASSDLGSSSTDNLTNDDTPTLAGFAGVELFGATVDFTSSLDGLLGSTTVGADGVWQITLPQLSQGNNWITATITAPDASVTTETIKLGIDIYAAISIDQPIAGMIEPGEDQTNDHKREHHGWIEAHLKESISLDLPVEDNGQGQTEGQWNRNKDEQPDKVVL